MTWVTCRLGAGHTLSAAVSPSSPRGRKRHRQENLQRNPTNTLKKTNTEAQTEEKKKRWSSCGLYIHVAKLSVVPVEGRPGHCLRPSYDQDDDVLHHPEEREVRGVAVVDDVTEGRRGRTRTKTCLASHCTSSTKWLRGCAHTHSVSRVAR